jgi:hypothetical protein
VFMVGQRDSNHIQRTVVRLFVCCQWNANLHMYSVNKNCVG